MKEILVASALSAGSDRANDRALMLADEHDANLTVSHVIDINFPQPTIDSHDKSARKRLEDHLSARTSFKAVTIQVVVGNPHLDILEQARQCHSDLIMVGAHRMDLLCDTPGHPLRGMCCGTHESLCYWSEIRLGLSINGPLSGLISPANPRRRYVWLSP